MKKFPPGLDALPDHEPASMGRIPSMHRLSFRMGGVLSKRIPHFNNHYG
jgi:hypothetical protein